MASPVCSLWLLLFPFALALQACGDEDGDSAELSDTDGVELSDPDGDGVTAADGDCDDSDPTVYPGADDADVDGTDQDCDGVDGLDADGDGYADAEAGGEDCDDGDAAVYEDCDGDGVTVADGDCDDSDATSLTVAEDPECDGFYLDLNGVTVLCPGVEVDDAGLVGTKTHTRVDDSERTRTISHLLSVA
jgi:hypothetical protein